MRVRRPPLPPPVLPPPVAESHDNADELETPEIPDDPASWPEKPAEPEEPAKAAMPRWESGDKRDRGTAENGGRMGADAALSAKAPRRLPKRPSRVELVTPADVAKGGRLYLRSRAQRVRRLLAVMEACALMGDRSAAHVALERLAGRVPSGKADGGPVEVGITVVDSVSSDPPQGVVLGPDGRSCIEPARRG